MVNFTNNQVIKKLGLWLVLSLVLSFIFFQRFWTSLPAMLSLDWIFGQYHVAPWGVLGLCLIFLWLKRKKIWKEMLENWQVRRLEGRAVRNFINLRTFKLSLIGVGLVVGAILMPSSPDYLIFQVLMASLGVFVMLFGKGAKIPSILLAIYGFAISFPLAIQRFAENAYSQTAILPVTGVLTALGYPLQSEGHWVHLTSTSGELISVVITTGCAGPATMGVFIALFTLMTLDSPLPPKKAILLFLFGVVGTWFQSFIRLVFLMLMGYYLGENALWTAHFWSIYIVFPLWYLLFAYIYFRQVGKPAKAREKQELKLIPMTVR